jgi:hypothetical protein
MRRMIGFLSATTLSMFAMAQSPPDPLEACAQKSDAAARLACFDQEMQRRHANNTTRVTPAPEARAATVAPATAAAKKPADDTIGLAGSQLRKKQRDAGIVVERPKPPDIVAQVSRAVSHPDHRFTFFLDNGQVWEQIETQQGLFVDKNESVTIGPGVLGAFFLKTSKEKYVRVRRLQ